MDKRTNFRLGMGICLLGGLAFAADAAPRSHSNHKRPNVIYIMADDLGIGDLGCYGQQKIKTPNIDRMAEDGMMFSRHYSGSTVSAPSRCCLMTGKHTGHAAIRGNHPVQINGEKYDTPLPASEVTVASILKEKGYVTGCFGKWGMGGPGSEGAPEKHGFDAFCGYLGQGHAHAYYPEFIYENGKKVFLNEEVDGKIEKKIYSHDYIMEKAYDFIEENAGSPFFLYLSPTIPHAELIVPEGEYGEYIEMFAGQEKIWPGGHYCRQETPRAAYAAMVSRLDRNVGEIKELLKKKGIYDNTIIVFTSDNGVHKEGGHSPEFFNSNGGFRGVKRDLYEGGIRTPFIVQWPDRIPAGSTTDHLSAFWDFLPTMCQLVGAKVPEGVDGISYLPTLVGGKQKTHDYLYYEFFEAGGRQAVLDEEWKLIRLNVNKPDSMKYELYNLKEDPAEKHDLSSEYPEKVKELQKKMDGMRTENPIFKFKKNSK